MPNNAELRITTDIVDALDMHRGSKPTTPAPVVILAAFLDSLAKSYGLSESGRIDEDPLGRISLPPAAGALISHYLADGAAQMEADAVRSRLYHVFVELSGNVDVQRALNKSKPLTELAVLHLAQVYWNLEGNYERPKLPIRPRAITVQGGGSVLADIPVTSVANKDFAIMNWTARVNEKAEYKSSGQAFRKQGACLAVLAANHIVEANPTPPPSLGDAVLRDDTKDGGSGVSIVWPTPGEATQAEREPFTGGCSGRTSIATITSRARAHYSIDSLEQDLRNTIDHFVRD